VLPGTAVDPSRRDLSPPISPGRVHPPARDNTRYAALGLPAPSRRLWTVLRTCRSSSRRRRRRGTTRAVVRTRRKIAPPKVRPTSPKAASTKSGKSASTKSGKHRSWSCETVLCCCANRRERWFAARGLHACHRREHHRAGGQDC
jgi:hypothetical protein